MLKTRTAFVHKGANSCLFFDTNHSKHVLPNHNHVKRSLTVSDASITLIQRGLLISRYNPTAGVFSFRWKSTCFNVTVLSVSQSILTLQEAYIYPL